MNDDLKQLREAIDREFATGAAALNAGNDGMARVCSRRAAGLAIGYYSRTKGLAWPTDAMAQLRMLSGYEQVPSAVREAAVRLTTKVTDRFHSPFSENPLGDARMIVAELLNIEFPA